MSKSSRDTIEAVCFKPAAGGGFVFQAPRPWLFGEAHHYLVSEAQKAEILAIIAPTVPAWRRMAIFGACILTPVLWAVAVSSFMWAVSVHDEPTGGVVVAMALLILVPLMSAGFLALARTEQAKLAKLAPLIARLPPSKEQITMADKRRGMARSA